MADQSQYLLQALQQMGAQPAVPAQPAGPDLAAMQKMAQDKQAWEAANPGQSYAIHGIGQMGQNLQDAPGRALGAIQGLPGQTASGLQALIQRFGGGQQPVY